MKYHNVISGSWNTKTSLEIARSHPPTAIYKDKLYAFGGGGPKFKSQNTSIVYDPALNSWKYIAPMPSFRSGAIAKTVGDAIYVIGGGFKQDNGTFKFLRTTEIYYPDRDIWEKGPDMIMPHDYPAGALLGGHIYILGGHHPDAVVAGPQTDPGFDFCERLHLATGRWEQIAPLPTPRFALDAEVIDDKIVTLGGVAFTPQGFNNFDHTEVYDPSTGLWQRGSITLPWTAAGMGCCLLHNHLIVFGGYSGDGISDHVAGYDLATQKWSILAPMPGTLAAMGVGVIGNTAYLVGGWADDRREPQSCVYAFNT
ncbi:MAG: hypothetical protein HY940_02500 [Gammaproteobacteria bacterium]|nr:hypothetical protein [Gammaproteobacteria bacterium]